MEPIPAAEPARCVFLPQALWALVVRHSLAATASAAAAASHGASEDGTSSAGGGSHRAVLRQCAILLAVSRHVAAAVRDVQLCLDMRAAPEEDLQLLPPLLTRLRLRTLLLGPRHASGAEALLRCHHVSATSAATLETLAATVACTDTLQRYPCLQELHLHAGVLDVLYPAVLQGLPALRHLGLHGYQIVQLAQLPPSVAATLQVLEVTPRPEAMRCQLSVRLPAGMRLRQLTVHGSFHSLLSSKAAPRVFIDTLALSRQCECVHIEAQQAVWQLPASCYVHSGVEAALAAALLDPPDGPAAWSRLELRVLEGAVVELAPPSPSFGPGGLLPARQQELDLERFAEVVQRLGGQQLSVSLHWEPCSVVHPWVLRLARDATNASCCKRGGTVP